MYQSPHFQVVSEFRKTIQSRETDTRSVPTPVAVKIEPKTGLTNSGELEKRQDRPIKTEHTTYTDRKSSASTLLDEIEQSFAQTSGKKIKEQHHSSFNNAQDILWLTLQPTTVKTDTKDAGQAAKDPFANFDKFIPESPKKNDKNKIENKSTPSSPVP